MFSFPVFFSARIVHPPMKEVKLNVAQIQTVSISFHGDRSEEARRTPVSELLEFIENVKRHRRSNLKKAPKHRVPLQFK
jgi:pyridoxal/pyridoxine/pyridoxamine kinase